LIGGTVYSRSKDRRLGALWALICLSLFCWAAGIYAGLDAVVSRRVFVWSRLANAAILFSPVFFYHFIQLFLRLDNKAQRTIRRLLYLAAGLLVVWDAWPPGQILAGGRDFIFDHFYISDWWRYKPPALFAVQVIFYSFVLGYALFQIFKAYPAARGPLRSKLRYFILGTLVGWLWPVFLWLLGLGMGPFSYYDFLLDFYPFLIGYAVINYRLLDLRLTLARITVFLAVYMLAIGLPLWLAVSRGLWPDALFSMAAMSLAAPFVYNWLARKVEGGLFTEHREVRKSVEGFIKGLPAMINTEEILQQTLDKMDEVLSPDFCGIYTIKDGSYYLSYAYVQREHNLPRQIHAASLFARSLAQAKGPALGRELESDLSLFQNDMVMPYFVKGELYAFGVLGPRHDARVYGHEDMTLFRQLSAQVGQAIENCILAQEKARLMRDEQARRQMALDNFSASLAHEIDNPIYSVMGLAEVVKMKVEDLASVVGHEDMEYLNDRLSRLVGDVYRISRLIKAIREFSSQTHGEFCEVRVDELLDSFLSIVNAQIKQEGITLDFQKEPGLKVQGNKIYLEEVLVNLAINAIHAVKHSGLDNKRIALTVSRSGDICVINMADNGYGIKKEMLEDIFLDFVTTKASCEGTGMGLARVRKIVELHKGKVWARSDGVGKGAEFIVEIPLINDK